MSRLFAGVRAPSTLGTFLPAFTFGPVRQLDSVAAAMLAELARRTLLLAGGDELAYGYAKQGAGCGYSGVKGRNALIAMVSTPLSAPVICATRLRKGSTNSARGAARLVADALVAAKTARARRQRADRAARRQCVLQPRRDRRGPPGRSPILASPPG